MTAKTEQNSPVGWRELLPLLAILFTLVLALLGEITSLLAIDADFLESVSHLAIGVLVIASLPIFMFAVHLSRFQLQNRWVLFASLTLFYGVMQFTRAPEEGETGVMLALLIMGVFLSASCTLAIIRRMYR